MNAAYEAASWTFMLLVAYLVGRFMAREVRAERERVNRRTD